MKTLAYLECSIDGSRKLEEGKRTNGLPRTQKDEETPLAFTKAGDVFCFSSSRDACQGHFQQFLGLPQCLSQRLIFCPELGSFFLLRHGLSVSEKVKSEQFPVI